MIRTSFFGENLAMPLPALKKQNVESAPELKSDEVELIQRVIAGDRNAFRALVEAYQERVFSIALGVVGRREEAEDVAQEAFLKAYRNLNSFRGQSSFYTWIYRITFNLAIDVMRKRKRQSEYLGDVSPELAEQIGAQSENFVENGNPEVQFSRSELAHQIGNALGNLSAEHRSVIMLREVDGLSYQEISDVMKCSKGTVMSRLHHARKKLQQVLSEA